MKNEYVQYGCGLSAPANWRNFDASPTLRFERLPFIGLIYTRNISRFPKNIEYGDITKGLPLHDNSCKGIYCSHILEHLSLDDFRLALKNTHNLLQKNGIFRLVLPDLEYSIIKYSYDSSSEAAVLFLTETALGRVHRFRGLKEFLSDWFGNNHHLWMWDYKSIEQELKNVGFDNIRRATFGDSSDKIFNDAENEDRWINSLGVECQKL